MEKEGERMTNELFLADGTLSPLGRWLFWKKQYYMTSAIWSMAVTVPMWMISSGKILRGVFTMMIIYLLLNAYLFFTRRRVDKRDHEFMEKNYPHMLKKEGKAAKALNIIFTAMTIIFMGYLSWKAYGLYSGGI